VHRHQQTTGAVWTGTEQQCTSCWTKQTAALYHGSCCRTETSCPQLLCCTVAGRQLAARASGVHCKCAAQVPGSLLVLCEHPHYSKLISVSKQQTYRSIYSCSSNSGAASGSPCSGWQLPTAGEVLCSSRDTSRSSSSHGYLHTV
jgi:hypothetical protein